MIPKPDVDPEGDRFAAMGQDGPCPTCGHDPNGPPKYRPKHPKPIGPEARAEYARFADKPEGMPR